MSNKITSVCCLSVQWSLKDKGCLFFFSALSFSCILGLICFALWGRTCLFLGDQGRLGRREQCDRADIYLIALLCRAGHAFLLGTRAGWGERNNVTEPTSTL